MIAALLAAAAVTLTPCKPPHVEESLSCGKVTVAENPAKPDGRTIDLNVVVLPSLSNEKREPLFELDGGPGLPATKAAGLFAGPLRAYRAHRDVVLVDQRGTGASNPLQCPKSETCLEESRAKADLRFYGTPYAVDDLDRVRAALGYDRIDLEGISYGTRVALEYIRRHRDHVRHVVMMGATATWATLPLYHAANAQRAFDLLFADAASKYPNLRAELLDVIGRLRAKPDPVSAGEFVDALRSMMYLPVGAAHVPKIIDAAARGDFAPFMSQRGKWPGAEGDYRALTCSEDVTFIREDEVRRVTAGTYLGDYRVRRQQNECKGWPHATMPADFRDDVTSDVPVLIFAGERDPVTAPAWSEAIAAHLSHAVVVHVEHDAHLPIGLAHLECWDAIENHFLDEGVVRPEDTACVAQMTAPPFE